MLHVLSGTYFTTRLVIMICRNPLLSLLDEFQIICGSIVLTERQLEVRIGGKYVRKKVHVCTLMYLVISYQTF